MKKTMILVGLVLSLLAGIPSFAAETIKIGSVNFQQALNEVDQGKRAKAALKTEFDGKQKKLDIQQKELKSMQEEMEKQKAVLSQDAMMAKQKTFSDKYMALQKNMAAYRDELVQREAKMTGQILQNLKSAVSDIAQKEGFMLVVETSQDAVLYAQTKEDLTNRVVQAYNKKYTTPLKVD